MSARYACCKHCDSEARDLNGVRRIGHHFPCQMQPCVSVPFEEARIVEEEAPDAV